MGQVELSRLMELGILVTVVILAVLGIVRIGDQIKNYAERLVVEQLDSEKTFEDELVPLGTLAGERHEPNASDGVIIESNEPTMKLSYDVIQEGNVNVYWQVVHASEKQMDFEVYLNGKHHLKTTLNFCSFKDVSQGEVLAVQVIAKDPHGQLIVKSEVMEFSAD